LFLGALRYYKGLHVLLEALKGRDYPTVIVGRGDQHDALVAQAKQLGLTKLHFVPEVTNDEKRSLMRAAYGFVFPSHMPSEAFGIVLAEAAQQGPKVRLRPDPHAVVAGALGPDDEDARGGKAGKVFTYSGVGWPPPCRRPRRFAAAGIRRGAAGSVRQPL
jgi:glycosyltransferase involved in cell wall biosynthesis